MYTQSITRNEVKNRGSLFCSEKKLVERGGHALWGVCGRRRGALQRRCTGTHWQCPCVGGDVPFDPCMLPLGLANHPGTQRWHAAARGTGRDRSSHDPLLELRSEKNKNPSGPPPPGRSAPHGNKGTRLPTRDTRAMDCEDRDTPAVFKARKLLTNRASRMLKTCTDKETVRLLNVVVDREGVIVSSGAWGRFTFGLGLLGLPEIMTSFDLADVPDMDEVEIMDDLIIDEMNGKKKLVPGRRAYACKYGFGYHVRDVDPSMAAEMRILNTDRADGRAAAVFLDFAPEADRREGRDLPGSTQALAMYRDMNGKSTFTGLVKIPMPSPTWHSAGMTDSVARPLGSDICGPCRIVDPLEFLDVMSRFDKV